MRVFSERHPIIAGIALAQVVLDVAASAMFFAVYDFNVGVLAADPGAFPPRGADVADLLRWGMVIDMLAYLALAPVVLHLHSRLIAVFVGRGESTSVVNLLTFGGLGFSIVGAIGAALFASGGPALLDATAAAPANTVAAHVAFAAVANGVIVGLWGTLEWLLLGVWLIGVGWIVRPEGKLFSWLAIVAGAGALVYDAQTGLTGHAPVALTSLLDIASLSGLGLFVVWLVWLAIRLSRGR